MFFKKCSGCGNENDPLLTNCLFCKSSLPVIDINSISNEQLVMNAGQWIGKLKDGFYQIKSNDYNQWTGKGITRMEKAEIQGYALQYLSLVQVRAISNINLAGVYNNLKTEYDAGLASDDAYTRASKSVAKVFIIYALFGFAFLILLFLMLKR